MYVNDCKRFYMYAFVFDSWSQQLFVFFLASTLLSGVVLIEPWSPVCSVCYFVVSVALDTEFDFHLTGRGCAPPSPSVPAPSAMELPTVSVLDTQDEPDMAQKEEVSPEQQETATLPGENTPVQVAAGETKEALNTLQDSSLSERESEPSVEIMFGGLGPGEGGMSANCGDGVLHTLAPPTNLSIAGSHARQRPTMPAPSPPVSVGGGSNPIPGQGGLLSMGTVQPSPTTTVPTSPSQSVHFDMYSTLFALHSLGDGGSVCSDYLTRVRALWDGQFQSTSSLPASSEEELRVSALLAQGAGPVSPHPESGQLGPSPSVPSSKPRLRAASERGWAAAGGSAENRCQGWSPYAKGSQGQSLFTAGSQFWHPRCISIGYVFLFFFPMSIFPFPFYLFFSFFFFLHWKLISV